jgi:FkbM family methyltransferase
VTAAAALRLGATLRFILSHPLNRGRPLHALGRFAWWQLASRLRSEIEFRWIDDARLNVRRGMTGATGNIYCGLHEFVEMAFVLHLLRPRDLFLDIGANIGSYTVLASKVCGARTIAFEPDPEAAAVLSSNIRANNIESLASVRRTALGDHCGEIGFTTGLDTTNRVAVPGDDATQIVPLARLDDIPDAAMPTLIKLDVEGYEEHVLAGAGRVLESPSLLAVQSELCSRGVNEVLGSFGFKPAFYDPPTRKLADRPLGHRVINMLYVRDDGAVAERVAVAPRRQVAGKYL